MTFYILYFIKVTFATATVIFIRICHHNLKNRENKRNILLQKCIVTTSQNNFSLENISCYFSIRLLISKLTSPIYEKAEVLTMYIITRN